MSWFKVTFMVEAENADAFDRDFSEEKIATALPGHMAYLVSIEEQPTIAEAMRATWKKLRRSS